MLVVTGLATATWVWRPKEWGRWQRIGFLGVVMVLLSVYGWVSVKEMSLIYEDLGIDRDSEKKYIKNEYRKLSRQYFPDKIVNSPEKIQYFNEMHQKYNTLLDSECKFLYDYYDILFPTSCSPSIPPISIITHLLTYLLLITIPYTSPSTPKILNLTLNTLILTILLINTCFMTQILPSQVKNLISHLLILSRWTYIAFWEFFQL